MEDNKDFDKDEQGQDTQQMPHVPAEGEEDGKKGTIVLFGHEFDKKKAVMAGLGGLLALALIGGGVWCAASQKPEPKEPAPVEQVEKTEQHVIQLGAKADGWVKGESSPVIAHIVNEDEKVDYYHAYDANVAVELDVPADGDYKVSFITPVNKDGSIYEVPAETAVKAETVKKGEKGDGEGTLPFTFKPVKAADASTDDLNAVAEAVTEAVKKGDGTLSGENGTKVIETVKANLKANQNADEKKVEEETQKAEESKPADGKDEAAPQKNDAGTGNGSAPTGGSSNQSQGGGSGTGGNSGSNGSSGGSNNSGGESKPQHTHNWVAQTTVVHHDAQYKTIHHDAVTEVHAICNNCNADITGNIDGHFKENILSGCGSYHTSNIVIQDAWDETVEVSPAWDETITTGYACSGCGAVK